MFNSIVERHFNKVLSANIRYFEESCCVDEIGDNWVDKCFVLQQ